MLDTIDRMRRKQTKKGTETKSKSRPKRKKASEKLINEPCRRSKRNNTTKSWAHLNDDDSTFLPSVSTATNAVDKVDNVVEIGNNRKSCGLVVVMRMLLDPEDTEIKQFIGAQFQNDKYHGKKIEGTKSDGRGRRPGPKTVWAALLEPFVQARQNTKNSVLFNEFINSLGNVNAWPSDLPRDQEDNNKANRKKVTAAIGNIKQRLKNQMKKALLA